MRSRSYSHELGFGTIILFGVSVTVADMAAGRDPVLVRAAELAGVKLDPEKAGSLIPVEWRK